MMSIFKTSPAALEDYLKTLGYLETLPNRCDLYFKPRFTSFFNQQDSFKCFKRLIALASQNKSIVIKLKMIICLHHLVMCHPNLHQQVLDNMIQGLEANNNIQNDNSVKWLYDISNAYYNYIRRICSSSEIYQIARLSKSFSKNQSTGSLITKVYMVINLIKNAVRIKQFILNFGRYFKAQFPIIVDINKNVANDMGLLYNYFVQIVNHLFKDYKHKLSKDQTKQLLTIVDQTFLIHEELYVLFYNRYYAYDIQAPKVNWLKIQSQQYEQLKSSTIQKKKKKKLDASKASIDSMDLSQFQKTYFSQTASTNKEFEFQGLQI